MSKKISYGRNEWVAGSYNVDGTANAVDPYPLVVDPWL